ncbi:MAG: glycosyltransferase, partial [Lachnospiraceae bacterium]|nr:glycosyltransferase [Lachnospiraceae bacterium]
YYVVFPTKNEGYGLPVVEAIQRGVPVIGSDIPVVREVGKEYISYVDNTRPEELVDLIKNAMDNEEKYAEAREKLKDYVAYRWDDCVNALCEKLEAVC